MKCFRHTHNDALSTCIHCGRALCQTCMYQSRSGRIVCSSACAEHLSAAEDAVEVVREKMVGSTRYTAYFLIAGGLAFGASALIDLHRGRRHLAPFTLAMALIFIGTGAALLWVMARKRGQRPDSSTTPVPDQYFTVQDAANDR